MSRWIGFAVSVNCGEPLGCYQGTILEADGATITLTKPFRNGFPYPKAQVTLNAADIKELKIIESHTEPSERAHSTVAVTKTNKKSQRATVCENLQAFPSSSGNSAACQMSKVVAGGSRSELAPTTATSTGGPQRSKPIDIQQGNRNRSNQAGSYGAGGGSTPRAGGRTGPGGGGGGGGGARGGAAKRNEECFGEALDPDIHTEFDFEKNLALFDKQAVWKQMRNSHKPDLLRQTEAAGKYRHDENVLGAGGAGAGAGAGGAGAVLVHVPVARRGAVQYATDEGTRVHSACSVTRAQLWAGLGRAGAGGEEAALLLLARAAADVALRLVGGGRRLDARNSHQVPTVVVIVREHRLGACGVMAARLLLSHGVRTCVCVLACDTHTPTGAHAHTHALHMYTQCGGETARAVSQLPATADLVLLATHDPADLQPGGGGEGDYGAALEWVSRSRAGVVCIEPGAGAGAGGAGAGAGGVTVSARASVAALVPPALPAELGKLYLANVAPPHNIFSELNIKYRSPFGAASVLPLHPHEDE